MELRRRESCRCFVTFDILVDGKFIGAIQQVDCTQGIDRVRYPRDLWILFGADDLNLPKPVKPKDEAIKTILELSNAS